MSIEESVASYRSDAVLPAPLQAVMGASVAGRRDAADRWPRGLSGHAHHLGEGIRRAAQALERLYKRGLDGPAVRTGLNAHKDFAVTVAGRIAEIGGVPLIRAEQAHW